MRKIAIFVEGQTEQAFAEKLLSEMAAAKGIQSISVTRHRAQGRAMARMPSPTIITADGTVSQFYALIWDCGTDNRVKSDIRDRYDSLVAAGYGCIVGIRDVHPIKRSQIPNLRHGLASEMKTDPVRVRFVLGIMEVESWFIAEHTHFARLHSDLTPELIAERIGFDPARDDPESLDRPSVELHRMYSLVGLAYSKTHAEVQQTVAALDYEAIRLKTTGHGVLELDALVDLIDRFIS